MQVHRDLGPGFLESVYHNCLALRMAEACVPFEREKLLEVEYLGRLVGTFRADFVCFREVIVEIKANHCLGRADVAQLANYLSATRQPLGVLLIGTHAKDFRPEDLPP